MLEIRLLHALIALDEERSVTSAAERLKISQPAMSATLRRLRDLFSDTLFIRSPKGLIPTDTADEILQRARHIVGLVDSLEQEKTLFHPESDAMELKIAASDFALSTVLPTLMRNLQKDAPLTKISITPLALGTVAHSLENGSLDFAVAPDFLAPETMQMRKLYDVDFVYLMRDGHPLLEAPITLKSLSSYGHLRVAPTSVYRSNRVGKIFENAGYSRNIRLTISNYSSAFDVVRNTDLIVFAPRNIAHRLGKGFATCEPPFELKAIVMSLIWHPKKQNSKSHIWARNYLADTIKSTLSNP